MKKLLFWLLANLFFFTQHVQAQALRIYNAEESGDDHILFYDKEGLIENDGGVSAIYSVPSYQCVGEINPSVEIVNYGSNELTNALIKYALDAEAPGYFVWEGNLLPGEVDVIEFNAIEVEAGEHVFAVSIVEANGLADINGGNNEGLVNFYIVGNSIPVPLYQQFDSGSLPEGYFLENTDVFGWKMYSQEKEPGNLNHMLQMPFFNCNAGIVNMAYIQNLDLSAIASSYLNFDVAYRYYQNSGLTNFDRLLVEISEDCGVEWKVAYDKQKDELATLPPSGATDYFPQEDNEWRTELIDLSGYAGHSNVMIRFNAFSGHGNNLYIDNLKISATVGINDIHSIPVNLEVYPSPADDLTAVRITSDQPGSFSLVITNSLGQKCYQSTVKANSVSAVRLDAWPSGLYHIMLVNENAILQQKSLMVNHLQP